MYSPVVLGGEAAVSPAVVQQLADRGINVIRGAGANRFETATNVADLSKSAFGFSDARISLANGERFPDALSAAPRNGQVRVPIVLATEMDLPAATRSFIEANASTINDVTIFGGTSAISEQTANNVKSAASAAN